MSLIDDDQIDLFECVPDLPAPPVRRWTVRRKAAVITVIREGAVPVEEACRLYMLSVDEILAWERDLDRFGVPGLRATRYQIYRGPRQRKAAGRPRRNAVVTLVAKNTG